MGDDPYRCDGCAFGTHLLAYHEAGETNRQLHGHLEEDPEGVDGIDD